MPIINCDNYQTIVPLEQVVTLTTTAVQNLFASANMVLSAIIVPHPDNQGTVNIGFASAPENQHPLQLDFMGRSFKYNLADVRVQASVANDKVIVLSVTYP